MMSLGAVAEPVNSSDVVEQMVITGTRTEKRIDDSPVRVDVITAKELAMVTTGTVAQALDFLPGVTIERSAKDGYNVQMQGFDGSRVLVLVDGLPLIAPTGSSVDLDQISILDIERIEVIRGAASTLYGSSAMGGVINIITRESRANTLRIGLEQGVFTADDREASALRKQANVKAAVANKVWSGELSAQFIRSDGFDYDASTLPQDAAKHDKNFFRARLGYDFSFATAQVTSQYFDEQKYKVIGPFPGEGNNYYTSDVTQAQHNLYLDGDTGWQLKVRRNDHSEKSGQRTGLRHADFGKTDVDTQKVWQVGAVEWVGGAHYYNEAMVQAKTDGTVEINDKQRDGLEVFIQSDWVLNDHWELVGGLRAQNDSGFGYHNALKLNSKWQKTFSSGKEITWRTSLGEGYRVPNLKERFFDFDHSNIGYVIEGNEHLLPESSLSFNSSLAINIPREQGEQWRAEINVHQSRAKDFIETEVKLPETESAGYSVYGYDNVDRTRMQGVDLSSEYRTGKQRVQLNYSYLDARDAHTWERLPNRPYHQVKANYWLHIPRWDAEALFYVVLQKDEAYGQLNSVKNSYAIFNTSFKKQMGQHFYWRVGVDNLFDEHRDPSLNEEESFDIRPISSRYVFASIHFAIL